MEANSTVASSHNTLILITNLLLFKHIPCIYYRVWFKKDQTKIQALINSSSKDNIITWVYVAKLGLKI